MGKVVGTGELNKKALVCVVGPHHDIGPCTDSSSSSSDDGGGAAAAAGATKMHPYRRKKAYVQCTDYIGAAILTLLIEQVYIAKQSQVSINDVKNE